MYILIQLLKDCKATSVKEVERIDTYTIRAPLLEYQKSISFDHDASVTQPLPPYV